MASATAKIRVKRADTATTFVSYTRALGEEVGDLRSDYAREEKLDPKTIAFHKVEPGAVKGVDKKQLSGAARQGEELGSADTWVADTWVLAYGDPLGKSPVREFSLLFFRLLPLLSTATHFIRTLRCVLLCCSGGWCRRSSSRRSGRWRR
jgi:hypothetical protein